MTKAGVLLGVGELFCAGTLPFHLPVEKRMVFSYSFSCKPNSCMAESLVQRDCKCYAEDSLKKFMTNKAAI